MEPVQQPHLAEIYALALEAFDTKEVANDWLYTYHRILGDTPINAAESTDGANEVKKILSSIIYGGVV